MKGHYFLKHGFETFENIFEESQIDEITSLIEQSKKTNANHRSNGGLFAIREFLLEYPEVLPYLYNQKLYDIIKRFGEDYRIIRSIYFDKPPKANWIVNWHQDLTINVDQKLPSENFKNWRVLANKVVVQPPIAFLQNIITIRIHLDDCNEENGALQVLPESHQKGIIPVKDIHEELKSKAKFCPVKKGGIMLMRPLLLHFSRRADNNQRRRVIHLELTNKKLPENLKWMEEFKIEEIMNLS